MNFWQLPLQTLGNVLLKNARIIDPESGVDFVGSLLVKDGLIADFSESLSEPSDSEVVNCRGRVLIPGLLDIQVHFREPGFEHKETLHSGSKAAVAGGITSVVCQPNTNPVIDNVFVLSYLQQKAKEEAFCNVMFYPAVSQGMRGEELTEMIELRKQGAVGFTDDGVPVANSHLMYLALQRSADLNVVIAQHAEDLQITAGGCINEGKVSQKLGVKGILNASEAACVERDLLLLEAVPDAHYHLLHTSTRQAMEAIIRYKQKGLNVTCEVCPHHLFLTEEAVLKSGTNAKMNPPLRSEEDRLFLLQALQDGWIDCITTDHAPHEKSSKDLPLESAAFGIVGVETLLPLSLKLFHEGKMSLIEVLKKLTCEPAKIIRQEKRGRIAKGCIADLILIDLDEKWTIKAAKLNSKSKNTPFDGWEVKGKVKKTFVNGNLVYAD